MDKYMAYYALLLAAHSGDEERIRGCLRNAQVFGLPETAREHFVLGFAVGALSWGR